MIFTTKITKEYLDKANTLRYAPCLFQEYIPKKTEFRVTIVGNELHSAEIHSQNSEKTKHDWRHYDDFKKTPYEQKVLPKKIAKSLLRLMKLMNLQFGAVDLIKTPDDNFVFLEVNPNGRWWWIQELTGMNIAKDIALFLSK
jgi:glutathione synthase/RimK-type ligase-like ATP-grasp enzyme